MEQIGLELEDQVIVALRQITRAIDLHSRMLLQQHGLTSPQVATLRAVARLEPVTGSRLARSVHLSQATVTGILSRLAERGLICRARNGKDRRSVVVSLTGEGARVNRSAPSLLHDHFRRDLAQLPPWEQTQILASLQRLAAMMEVTGRCTAPDL